MEERLGKRYDLGVCNNIRSSAGCVNKKNPQVVYITGKVWVTPTEKIDDENFDWNTVRRLRKEISMALNDFSEIFEKKYIFDMDLNTEGMVLGKHKFLSYSLYLKQKGNMKINDMTSILKCISNTLSYSVCNIYTNSGFILNEKKKC